VDGAQVVPREFANHNHLDTVVLVLRSHDCLWDHVRNSRLLMFHWALHSGKRRRILPLGAMPIAPVPAVALEIWHVSVLVAHSYRSHANTANADVQHASLLALHAYRVNTANANVLVHVQQKEGWVDGVGVGVGIGIGIDDPCFVRQGTVLQCCPYDA
jgi:hypothetical protein